MSMPHILVAPRSSTPPMTPPSDETRGAQTEIRTPASPVPFTEMIAYTVDSSEGVEFQLDDGETPVEGALRVLPGDRGMYAGFTPVVGADEVVLGNGTWFSKSERERSEFVRSLKAIELNAASLKRTVDANKIEADDTRSQLRGQGDLIRTLRQSVQGVEEKLAEQTVDLAKANIRIETLLDDRARELWCMRPILFYAIVKRMADMFAEEKKSDVGGGGSKESAKTGDSTGSFHSYLRLVEGALQGEKRSEKWEAFVRDVPSRRKLLQKGPLTKFLKIAADCYDDRAQVAHPNVSDEALLGLALEIERAGEDPAAEPNYGYETDRDLVPARLIMELLGYYKAGKVLQTLQAVIPVRREGTNRIISPIPRAYPDQVERHDGWFDLP